jgi:mannitol/fructose-specific phosphotransferase system IIA component (Ntr-type)
MVFLIAVPATDATQYLQLNSGLARLAEDTRLVEKLHAAPDAARMLEVLQRITLRSEAKPDLLKRAVA